MKPDPINRLKSTERMVDYDHNSTAQKQHADLQAVRIRKLIDRLGIVRPELRIVDYGCGPGMSAIETVRPAVSAYQTHYPENPISVCHADQWGNDWNSLFELASGQSGYVNGSQLVRVGAAVGSFYEQLVSDDSVALGTCFFASHWLSHAVRLQAKDTVWFADLRGAARAEMSAFAQENWIMFLRHRAQELKSGGYLLVSTLGAVPEDNEINGIAVSGRGSYRAMQIVAQDMVDDGLLRQDVLDGFLFSLWFMTAEEARLPIEMDPVLSQAFVIEEAGVEPAPQNPHDIFADSVSDPIRYAQQYAGYIRAFGESTLRTQLIGPSVSDDADVDRLTDEYFNRLEKLYREFTDKYACESWYLTIVLRKT